MDLICDTGTFAWRIGGLALNADYSDVTFLVEGEKIPGHRAILAACCDYFRALLYGGLAESAQTEIQLNVPLKAFKLILEFIYTGKLQPWKLGGEAMREVFQLAHQFGCIELESAICAYMRKRVSVENALWTRQIAELYNKSELLAASEEFIDDNAELIVQHESFNALTEESLLSLLQRDTLQANELKIFEAVQGWCNQHPDANVAALMSAVRFSLIDEEFLVQSVRSSGLVDETTLQNAIATRKNTRKLPHRATIIRPVWVRDCYDMRKVQSVNFIKCRVNMAKYTVKVAKTKKRWIRVKDHSKYLCNSYQYLHFRTQKARYIRFEGIQNGNIAFLHVDELVVMRTMQSVPMHDNIIVPMHNVVTPEMGATISKTVQMRRDVHVELNSDGNMAVKTTGEFFICTGQPYYVGTMSFHMPVPGSYKICTYNENAQWEEIIKGEQKSNNSWHIFSFNPRIVKFIYVKCCVMPEQEFTCVVQCPSESSY